MMNDSFLAWEYIVFGMMHSYLNSLLTFLNLLPLEKYKIWQIKKIKMESDKKYFEERLAWKLMNKCNLLNKSCGHKSCTWSFQEAVGCKANRWPKCKQCAYRPLSWRRPNKKMN